MLCPNQPEYLQLFSNEGLVTVKVKFNVVNDIKRSMPEMKMCWHELDRIINRETGVPYQHMFFDTHGCSIIHYKIEPAKNKLTLVVETADDHNG